MNVCFSSFYGEIVSYSNKNILFSISAAQYKKILIVATLAFSCLAACYTFYYYFWKKTDLNPINDNVNGKKNNSLDALKVLFPLRKEPEPVVGTPQPGLNLEGRCSNADCEAYNQLRIIPKGIKDHFNVAKEYVTTLCPCCQSPTSFLNINAIILDSCRFEIAAGSENQSIRDTFEVPPLEPLKLEIHNWRYMELKNLAKIP